MKITHLITELSMGGAQMALYRLVSKLDVEEINVYCFYNGDGLVGQKIRALGIPVYDLGMAQQKWRLYKAASLFGLLRKSQPDILHSWMFHANIPGRILGRLAGIPHIISAERTMGQEGKIRLWLNQLTARWADRIICNAPEVATFASTKIGLPAKKIVMIPNGVDIEKYSNLPSKAVVRAQMNLPASIPIAVAIGRPRPVKGYPLLLDAWQQTLTHFLKARLVMIGDGPDLPALKEYAQDLGIATQVEFWGERDDVPQLLPAFDLLVSSSYHEGMPNVVMEAMAARLPVVATAVGGTPSVINQDSGILAPPGQPDALANAICALFSHPDRAIAMGNAGKHRITTQFSLAKSVSKTTALYEELLYGE